MYQRLGEEPFRKLAHEFYDRVYADDLQWFKWVLPGGCDSWLGCMCCSVHMLDSFPNPAHFLYLGRDVFANSPKPVAIRNNW